MDQNKSKFSKKKIDGEEYIIENVDINFNKNRMLGFNEQFYHYCEPNCDCPNCILKKIKKCLKKDGQKTTENLTTGPIIRQKNSELRIKILNNTSLAQTVTVNIFDLPNQEPKTMIPDFPKEIILEASESELLLPILENVNELEIQFLNIPYGVYAYVTTLSDNGELNNANTYKHSELLPLIFQKEK